MVTSMWCCEFSRPLPSQPTWWTITPTEPRWRRTPSLRARARGAGGAEPGPACGTPGGGAYGSPLERDPQAVLADIIAGKVSVARARDAYGVAVESKRGRLR